MTIEIDITVFKKVNIVDCCAIWNVISSDLLYSRALESGCSFALTKYVEYECLTKPRSEPKQFESEMQQKLKRAINRKQILSHNLTIEDIQESEILSSRNKLGKGELSSIAFAKKIGQSFLTDDMGARVFAKSVLGKANVQTTTHLLGFMFFKGILSDGELDIIVKDHNSFERPLEKYFRIIFAEAMRIRLMSPS